MKPLKIEGLDINVVDPQERDEEFRKFQGMFKHLKGLAELQRAKIEANPWPAIEHIGARMMRMDALVRNLDYELNPQPKTFRTRVNERVLFKSIGEEAVERVTKCQELIRQYRKEEEDDAEARAAR